MNKEAGRGGLLFVTLRLETGEMLPFVVDTGCPVTIFDKSLEPKLGSRLGAGTSLNFGVKREIGIYAAPRLYLGSTRLQLAGTNILACDCKQLPSNTDQPIMGFLGMDVLEHYCLQLDFATGRMRFLDPETANKKGWGKPFPLTDLGDGCFIVGENLAGANGLGSLVDTGCSYDGWLVPGLFQQWTNQAHLPADGAARSPDGLLGGEVYSDIDLHGLDAKLLLTDDSHIKFNGIGLHFLSRHLVTFDFPERTLYLRHTSADPLLDEATETAGQAVAKSAVNFLRGLMKKGQLPGWSKRDEVATKKVHFYFHFPDSITCDHLQKKGDASVYHYEIARTSKDSPWQLQKAWRTDARGHLLEEYPVP